MPTRRVDRLLRLAWLLSAAVPAWAQGSGAPGLGVAVDGQAALLADPTVFADGTGLPPGAGSAVQGAALYAQHCARCHGERGGGGVGGPLAGAPQAWRDDPHPAKTIGQFWPHATTVFDYVRRAMPMDRPGSLAASEVYALTAYLLHLNGVWDARQPLDATTLPQVRMPNRDGFVVAPR